MNNVPRVSNSFNYGEFYSSFLLLNKPCIFDESLINEWPARKKWTRNSQINIDNIFKDFSNTNVSVADCSELVFGTHPMKKMSVSEYSIYWKSNRKVIQNKLFYLKDWHYFQQISTNPSPVYISPIYFSSDWLNEFCEFRTDVKGDFKFVYLGVANTWTPLHYDVHCSYSWSANIVGCKRWWLFPPGEEQKLISKSGKFPPDIREYEFSKIDDLDSDLPKCIMFDQNSGETVFVPSGWYHEVVNLTDCVSINHNWINACNIKLVWKHLQNQLKEVQKATSDVKFTPGWDEACQNCLKAWEGWNYAEFFLFVKYILISRWTQSSPIAVRKQLSSVEINDTNKVSFRILESSVDNLLSKLAKTNEKKLINRFIDTSNMDNVNTDWQNLLPLNNSTDCRFQKIVQHPEWIRQHDITRAIQTIQQILLDADFQKLNYHKDSTVSWLWLETGFLSLNPN